MRWCLWLGVVVGLAGCGPTQAELEAADVAQCHASGPSNADVGFAGCLLARELDRQTQRARWNAAAAALQDSAASYQPLAFTPVTPHVWVPPDVTVAPPYVPNRGYTSPAWVPPFPSPAFTPPGCARNASGPYTCQ